MAHFAKDQELKASLRHIASPRRLKHLGSVEVQWLTCLLLASVSTHVTASDSGRDRQIPGGPATLAEAVEIKSMSEKIGCKWERKSPYSDL